MQANLLRRSFSPFVGMLGINSFQSRPADAEPHRSSPVTCRRRRIRRSAAQVLLALVLLVVVAAVLIPRHLEPCECAMDEGAAAMCAHYQLFGRDVCVSCATRHLLRRR